MAINRAGFIARVFKRLARPAPPESGSADETAPVEAPHPEPREAADKPVPAPADEPTPAGALPAATSDVSERVDPATKSPATDAQADEAAEPPAAETDASADATAGRPEPEALPGADADANQDAGTTPEDGKPGDPAPAPTDAAAPSFVPAPVAREHKVITLLSLVEHAGAKTLGAALERRTEGTAWRIRIAGPGLARAAFAGMLGDTDALVLVSPADPEITAALGDKLRWLEANNRQGMQARTLVVVNLGAGDGGELQLPADLDRPVTLLPFDAAVGIPATGARAPRRAARAAIDQLVDELSTILQEN